MFIFCLIHRTNKGGRKNYDTRADAVADSYFQVAGS